MRISAVLVGLANAAVFALTADRPLDDAFSYFLGDLPSWRLSALYALCAVAAGLLASEIVLRLVSGGLRGGFYARYLAVCVGGVLLGALLVLTSVLTDGATTVDDHIFGALVMASAAGFAGGWLGFAEGLLLGVPLAALLRLAGERPTPL